jgi:hypothetical protein
MADELLRKYMGRQGGPGAEADETDSEGAEDVGGFGWLRGVRDRAVSLELRKKDGSVLAINYGWVERIRFEPSEGITLYASGQTIRIKGRNLNAEARPQIRLFQGLTRHRVPWVQEADRADVMRTGKDSAVVESIEW